MNNISSLDELHETINKAVSLKIVEKVLSREERHHFNHGWKGVCSCSVCEYRRRYVAQQSRPAKLDPLPTDDGEWIDVRAHRKALNKALKRKILKD